MTKYVKKDNTGHLSAWYYQNNDKY